MKKIILTLFFAFLSLFISNIALSEYYDYLIQWSNENNILSWAIFRSMSWMAESLYWYRHMSVNSNIIESKDFIIRLQPQAMSYWPAGYTVFWTWKIIHYNKNNNTIEQNDFWTWWYFYNWTSDYWWYFKFSININTVTNNLYIKNNNKNSSIYYNLNNKTFWTWIITYTWNYINLLDYSLTAWYDFLSYTYIKDNKEAIFFDKNNLKKYTFLNNLYFLDDDILYNTWTINTQINYVLNWRVFFPNFTYDEITDSSNISYYNNIDNRVLNININSNNFISFNTWYYINSINKWIIYKISTNNLLSYRINYLQRNFYQNHGSWPFYYNTNKLNAFIFSSWSSLNYYTTYKNEAWNTFTIKETQTWWIYNILWYLNLDWVCGTNAKNYIYTNTSYTWTFCSVWSPSPTTPAFPGYWTTINWQCLPINSWSTANCEAFREDYKPPINATCWSNAKEYELSDIRFSSTWTFCSSWTQNPYNPNFPEEGQFIKRTCNGAYLWINTDCIASKKKAWNTVLNGSCWTNAKTYEANYNSWYIGTFCSFWISSPLSPSFPSNGNTVYWTCQGLNWWENSYCTSFKKASNPINWSCWTNAKTYEATYSSWYIGTFCTVWEATPLVPDFPNWWATISRSCKWSNNWLDTTCEAIKRDSTAFWFNFSFITDSFTNLISTFKSTFSFKIDYLGFNFPTNFSNLFSLNFSNTWYILNQECARPMITNKIEYKQEARLNWSWEIVSSNLYVTVFGLYNYYVIPWSIEKLKECKVVEWWSSILDFDNIKSLLYPCKYVKYIKNWPYTDKYTVIYNWKFKYIDKVNNNNLIIYNDSILNSIKWFPFQVVIFWFDLSLAINDSILAIINFFINIFIFPINALNTTLNDISILFIDFTNKDSICFWGMTLDIFNKDEHNIPTRYQIQDSKYTTTLWLWSFLIFFIIVWFFLKKLFK